MGGQNRQVAFDVRCRGQDVAGFTWSSRAGWISSGSSASIQGRLEPPALLFSGFSFTWDSMAFTRPLCVSSVFVIFQWNIFSMGDKPRGLCKWWETGLAKFTGLCIQASGGICMTSVLPYSVISREANLQGAFNECFALVKPSIGNVYDDYKRLYLF